MEALNDKQQRYASNIQRSGQILLEMINEILDLAKIEAGKQEINPVEMNLNLVVGAQCDLVKSLVEEKNLTLDIKEAMADPVVKQDQGKIQQVLTNLLSNAIKFTPEGGRITVHLEDEVDAADVFVIRIMDTGIGIAEEDRELIFEKFRQGNVSSGQDNLTREYAGTGLGLSIVKEICRLLGGEVSVDSQLGIGSTFTVTLPREMTPVQPEAKSDINHRVDQLNRGQAVDFITQAAVTNEPPDSEADKHPKQKAEELQQDDAAEVVQDLGIAEGEESAGDADQQPDV